MLRKLRLRQKKVFLLEKRVLSFRIKTYFLQFFMSKM